MKLNFEKVDGLLYADFRDIYDRPCVLQSSSLATDNAIWLGIQKRGYKMLLNQEHVKALLPALEYFAVNGELPEKGGE
jgi:hypothetical protein